MTAVKAAIISAAYAISRDIPRLPCEPLIEEL